MNVANTARLSLPRENRFYASKINDEIHIERELYQNNPFLFWKEHFEDTKKLLAAIPFVRNLCEYIGFEDHYHTLTSILHFKKNTCNIKVSDFQNILRDVLKDKEDIFLLDGDATLISLIFKNADGIIATSCEKLELEDKILLSIAIRLKAESFLIAKINDWEFVSSITGNQTFKLIEKFCEIYPENSLDKLPILQLMKEVQLMTPENIHVNSFMYEPILDMSNQHLKRLYNEVKAL